MSSSRLFLYNLTSEQRKLEWCGLAETVDSLEYVHREMFG